MGSHGVIILLLGGIAIFMYGMTLAGEHLQRLAENRIRDVMVRIADRNFLAVNLGILLTIVLQSSGAVTTLLVSLGRARLIALREVMGVIIGSAIGTTFTVQLISFNVTQWGFGIFALSYFVYFLAKNRILKNLSAIAMGFGLVFFGLELMGMATSEMAKNKLLIQNFTELSRYPIYTFIVAALFTGFVHSSAVTIGIAMSLAAANIISFYDSMFWIFGANVGTTATAMMAAAGGNHIGKRVAWGNFLFKLGSVVLFVGFTSQFANMIEGLAGDMHRDIANAHTAFNLISGIVFFPFLGYGARLIEKLIKPDKKDKKFRTKYLRANTDDPLVALAQARRETLRLADFTLSMVKDSLEMFKSKNEELFDDIKKRDNKVGLLHHEIKMHLVEISQNASELGYSVMELIEFTNDLESAADVVDKELRRLALKKHDMNLEFSPEGWDEIQEIHSHVVEIVRLAIASFNLQDKQLSGRVISLKRSLRELERNLKQSHIERLNKGLKDTLSTSSIHMDVLGGYRRITGLVANHAYTIGREDKQP